MPLVRSFLFVKLLLALFARCLIPSNALRTSVILFHKPASVVTTHASNDVKGRSNVFQEIELDPSQWHAVGRLDADTVGLLLLTNDGGLVHHVTNKNAASASHDPISKTYHATIMGYHEDDSEIFHTIRETGVELGAKHGGCTLPAEELQVLNHPTGKSTEISIRLIEGKNRQIRRMFHALGSGVMKLKRVAIGSSLTLEQVPLPGDWCFLSEHDVESCLGWKSREIQETRKHRRKR